MSSRREVKVARTVSDVVHHHWSMCGTYTILGKLRRASWNTCISIEHVYTKLDVSSDRHINVT